MQLGNKPKKEIVGYRNAESSASIPPGTPLVFKMDGTDDGYACVLPSSASALLAQNFFAGLAADGMSITAGNPGNRLVYGMFSGAVVAIQTRAASTDSWSTAAALSVGQALSVNTVVNALVAGATSPQGTVNAITNSTQTGTASIAVALPLAFNNGGAVLAQTLASAAGSASSSNDTRLAITYALKVQLRMM